jgi:hypothetical protein
MRLRWLALVLAVGCSVVEPPPPPPPVKPPRPSLPPCLRVERIKRGQLAAVRLRADGAPETVVADVAGGETRAIAHAVLAPGAWSPSGERLLLDTCVGEDDELPPPAFWAPARALYGATDWLAIPSSRGSLVVMSFPRRKRQRILPRGTLGLDPVGGVLWSPDGLLAWCAATELGTESAPGVQTLLVQRASEPGVVAWQVSADPRNEYYQLVDWVPGTQSVLAARGALAMGAWEWGLPLVRIDVATGELTEFAVSMLPTSEAYAWHPAAPGLLAVAEGESRYLFEPRRLALLDLIRSELTYVTDADVAAYEPAWSPDGTQLAYAAVAAKPDVFAQGEAAERLLEGRAIQVVDLRSNETRQVTYPGSAIDGWPQWLPDGRHLLYTRQHDGVTDVRITTLDGRQDRVVIGSLPDPPCYYGGCGWWQMLALNPRHRSARPPVQVARARAFAKTALTTPDGGEYKLAKGGSNRHEGAHAR